LVQRADCLVGLGQDSITEFSEPLLEILRRDGHNWTKLDREHTNEWLSRDPSLQMRTVLPKTSVLQGFTRDGFVVLHHRYVGEERSELASDDLRFCMRAASDSQLWYVGQLDAEGNKMVGHWYLAGLIRPSFAGSGRFQLDRVWRSLMWSVSPFGQSVAFRWAQSAIVSDGLPNSLSPAHLGLSGRLRRWPELGDAIERSNSLTQP
jgi:hypothetical protein